MASGERWRIIRDMFRTHSRYVFDPCVFRPALLYYADCVLVKCARSTTNTLFCLLPRVFTSFLIVTKKKKGGRKEDETNRQHSETEARRFLVKSAWDSNPASSTDCKKKRQRRANCKCNRFIEILHVTLQVSGGGNFPTPPLPPPSPPHSAPVTSLDAGTLYVTSIAPARIRILMHCMHVHRTSRHKARQPTRGSNIVFQNPYLA